MHPTGTIEQRSGVHEGAEPCRLLPLPELVQASALPLPDGVRLLTGQRCRLCEGHAVVEPAAEGCPLLCWQRVQRVIQLIVELFQPDAPVSLGHTIHRVLHHVPNGQIFIHLQGSV